MNQHVCSNPACQKTYDLNHGDVDDGFCSFECFEAINCKVPQSIKFEEFSIDS
jgi:hypothetical protein